MAAVAWPGFCSAARPRRSSRTPRCRCSYAADAARCLTRTCGPCGGSRSSLGGPSRLRCLLDSAALKRQRHKAIERIIGIARNPLAPSDLGFTPPDGSREPLYRIKVELESQSIGAYGKPEPLRPGMQVEADILLDRRRLIEWIFEPILSLAGRA